MNDIVVMIGDEIRWYNNNSVWCLLLKCLGAKEINSQYFLCVLCTLLWKRFSSQVELEVEQNVLTTKVNLSDGSTGNIFSRNPNRNDARLFTYNCHVCSVPNLPGERCLYTHISGRRHQQRLANQPFNAAQFRAPLHRSNKSTLSSFAIVVIANTTKTIHSLFSLLLFLRVFVMLVTPPRYVCVCKFFFLQMVGKSVVMEIAPGEPVPPGFEDEVRARAEIQTKVDKCKNTPFIGLEYLLELSLGDDKEPGYLCVLCEKRGDPRTIMDHMTSYKHRLKYLVKHFHSIAFMFRLVSLVLYFCWNFKKTSRKSIDSSLLFISFFIWNVVIVVLNKKTHYVSSF